LRDDGPEARPACGFRHGHDETLIMEVLLDIRGMTVDIPELRTT
jgi:hypothetical protein